MNTFQMGLHQYREEKSVYSKDQYLFMNEKKRFERVNLTKFARVVLER